MEQRTDKPQFYNPDSGSETDLIPDVLIDCIGPVDARKQLRYLRDEVLRLRTHADGNNQKDQLYGQNNQKDQLYGQNKWGVRIIRRGADYDSAQIVKCKDFPEEVILAKAMWPNDAMNLVNEHNDAMAKALFKQDANWPTT